MTTRTPMSAKRGRSASTSRTAPVHCITGIARVRGSILSICSSDQPVSSDVHMESCTTRSGAISRIEPKSLAGYGWGVTRYSFLFERVGEQLEHVPGFVEGQDVWALGGVGHG